MYLHPLKDEVVLACLPACMQGTVLTTVYHIREFLMPGLLEEYTKMNETDSSEWTDEDKLKMSHIATALVNWNVSWPYKP